MEAMKLNLTSVVSGRYNKETKIGLFIANFLLMLPYVIKNHTNIGLIISLVILVLLFVILYKSNNNLPGVVYAPLTILADISIYIGLHFDVLKTTFNPKYYQYLYKGLEGTDIVLWLYVVGIALYVVGLLNGKNKNAWLTGVGCIVVLETAIIKLRSNADIKALSFEGYGASLFTWVLILGVVWTVYSQYTALTMPQNKGYYRLVEILLVAALLTLLTAETKYFDGIWSGWASALLELPHSLFAWWKVILATVIMVVGAYIKVDDSGFGFRVDSYALIIGAELVFSIKLMMSNYFPYCWVLLLVLIIGTFKVMINDYSNHKETLHLDAASYIVIQYVVFIVIFFMLKKGLWINLLISILWGMVFYNEFFVKKKSESNKANWYLTMSCIASEVIAWMWQFRFSIETLLMIALIFGGVFITFWIINKKHPASVTAPDSIRWILCIGMILLCLIAMTKYGTKIKFKEKQDSANQTVTVVIDARGKNNEISEAYYYWRDNYGRKTSEEKAVKGEMSDIHIKDEILTVITTDSHGVRTTSYYWYPHWLIEK